MTITECPEEIGFLAESEFFSVGIVSWLFLTALQQDESIVTQPFFI